MPPCKSQAGYVIGKICKPAQPEGETGPMDASSRPKRSPRAIASGTALLVLELR